MVLPAMPYASFSSYTVAQLTKSGWIFVKQKKLREEPTFEIFASSSGFYSFETIHAKFAKEKLGIPNK